ncbi:MAG: hypothetical protein EXS16_20145 [Gemmataceae bacterium]|nr:hypothetical protein [Gemmataceae bacterium]
MLKSNPKLDRFISEITSGEPSPIPGDDDAVETAIWSGDITELDARTYSFYATGNAGVPKAVYDGWFIFSVEKNVVSPGILFWQDGDRHFARRLDDEQWEDLLNAAKIKKSFW